MLSQAAPSEIMANIKKLLTIRESFVYVLQPGSLLCQQLQFRGEGIKSADMVQASHQRAPAPLRARAVLPKQGRRRSETSRGTTGIKKIFSCSGFLEKPSHSEQNAFDDARAD